VLRPPGCAGDPLRGAQRRSLGSVVRRVRGKETRGAFQERVAADRAAEPLCYAVGHCCDTATAFARREVTRAALRAGRRCATPLCLNTGPSAQRTRTERPRAPAGTEPRAAPLPLRDRGAALLSRCSPAGAALGGPGRTAAVVRACGDGSGNGTALVEPRGATGGKGRRREGRRALCQPSPLSGTRAAAPSAPSLCRRPAERCRDATAEAVRRQRQRVGRIESKGNRLKARRHRGALRLSESRECRNPRAGLRPWNGAGSDVAHSQSQTAAGSDGKATQAFLLCTHRKFLGRVSATRDAGALRGRPELHQVSHKWTRTDTAGPEIRTHCPKCAEMAPKRLTTHRNIPTVPPHQTE